MIALPLALAVALTQTSPKSEAVAGGPDVRGPRPPVHADGARKDGEGLPRWGLQIDGGFPAGLGMSLAWRPADLLRLTAGATYNLIGFGIRAGLDLVPFRSAVRPFLGAQVGRTFDADASGFAPWLGIPAADAAILRHVSYDYASLQLGLEVGSERGLSAFLSAGIGYLTSSAPGFAALVQAHNPNLTVSAADPTVRATVPVATLGIVEHFQ